MTVTLADQTLTDTVQSDGTWSVTPTHLADGPHRVVTTVSDAAGNQASASQTLTVNTVLPVVADRWRSDRHDDQLQPHDQRQHRH